MSCKFSPFNSRPEPIETLVQPAKPRGKREMTRRGEPGRRPKTDPHSQSSFADGDPRFTAPIWMRGRRRHIDRHRALPAPAGD